MRTLKPNSWFLNRQSSSRSSRLNLILCLLFLLTNCGCHQLSLLGKDDAKKKKAPESGKERVAEVICAWEPAEGVGLNGLPCRGFAGQILFFGNDTSSPIKVNGDVRIYVFDDHGSEEERAEPIHYFDFEEMAFQGLMTETNLGIAYQLFVPYTRKTVHEANCSLRVMVTPKDGGMPVYSKMATLYLQGPPRDKRHTKTKTEISSPIQQVSHVTTEAVTEADRRRSPEAVRHFGGTIAGHQVNTADQHRDRLKSIAAQAVSGASPSTESATPAVQQHALSPTEAPKLQPTQHQHPLAN
ncbi:hypothetical protein KOR42_32280 [Thalassoglobus neptunius]|uniref:Uncharacterized protein n=1 Tax=Thalassoglobus neptunius TaxID=1938619 RepID=A0A5C5WNZ0_9PLAN|nr:hypothetical protein [Thalassoglobus neptunius]TWT51945.1 hypothetical protein KOR42_32280 [Thalassoglobus neptunius]